MEPTMNALALPISIRRLKTLLGAVALSAMAVACGGGGEGDGGGSTTSGVGTGGTGTYASGSISGFGSVIVNGVRFDDSSASVSDDDGVSHNRGELKLGMVVGISGGALSDDAATGLPTGTATTIQYLSELKGTVGAVNVAGGTLQVLGQTVKVNTGTIFEGFANGLASVSTGNEIEVYALYDAATATFVATRIELKAGLTVYKLSGRVASLNTSAQTFVLGGQLVRYSSMAASQLPALSNGLAVRVKLQPTQVSGAWVATQIRNSAVSVPDLTEAELEGIVSDFVSLSNFKVNGVSVNASGVGVAFKDGSAASVVNGQRVEVKGMTQAGVLVASRVEIESESGGSGGSSVGAEIRLIGPITAADQANSSFVLKGLTVRYSGTTQFNNGAASSLAASVQVEVRGALSASGTEVVATRIKF
jgi:hypothetical protein